MTALRVFILVVRRYHRRYHNMYDVQRDHIPPRNCRLASFISLCNWQDSKSLIKCNIKEFKHNIQLFLSAVMALVPSIH